jgi:hypothetical protein
MLTKFILFLFFQSILLANYSTQALIILDDESNPIKKFSALELKKHLSLLLNEEVLISSTYLNKKADYIFYIGVEPRNILFKKKQSNYIINGNEIYLFGEDSIRKNEKTLLDTIVNMINKVGTLFSVYDFLYNELNVRWIKPGDDGIIYKKIKKLNLNDKSFSWNSDYSFRILRNDIWDYDKFINKLKMEKYTPKELQFSQEEVEKINTEDLLWKRRMKLQISSQPTYGHSFTKYWEKYGDKHPEWFALGENGERGINGFSQLEPSRQKFCVSNISLQNEIVNNWKKEYEKNGKSIYRAGVNDSRGYCTCDSCKLLDSEDHIHNEFQEKSKTDRYVYFWNSLLKKAKEFNPNSKITVYVYSDYRYPPEDLKISDDIIVGFVPKFSDLPEEINSDLIEWEKKGLTETFLRPNDFNDDIGLPMGHEKYIFDKLKVFKNKKLLGVDYDNAYNFNDWNFEGISKYVLLQAFNYPHKSFEEIENEYYEIFGTSKNDIKKYYKFWQEKFESKRLPVISTNGGFEGRKTMYKNLEKFYQLEDFTKTNEILQNSLKNADSENIKKIIENIIISNNHAKLIFETFSQKEEFTKNYKKLTEYRMKHKENLSLCWPQVFNTEERLNNNDYLKKVFSKILDNFE